MKNLKRIVAVTAAWALFAPAAFAAYDDVSLTTTVQLSVGGVTLNVSGSSAATLESITVNASTLSVTVPPGSFFKVSAPGLEKLTSSLSSSWVDVQCSGAESSVTYNANATDQTITITPSSTLLCSGTGVASGNGRTGGGSGGGSSHGSSSGSSSNTTTTTTNGDTAASLAALMTQLKALIAAAQAKGLNVPGSALTLVNGVGNANPNANAVANANANASFNRDLDVGATGDDVKALQVWLNTHGYVITTSGPGASGSETTTFGMLTKAALAKFQASVGISPAAGFFGPKTRAYLAAH